MGFGKRKQVLKKKKKGLVPKDKVREELIVNKIKGFVKSCDIECCNIEHIRSTMSKVDDLEYYVKKCVEKNGFILHKGWLYSKLWTVKDINEISNDTMLLKDFDDENTKIDNDLLVKLTALYERENEAIKVTWFETLISKGMLHLTEKQLYESLERLMRAGKIYEPTIGMFAPTYDSIY